MTRRDGRGAGSSTQSSGGRSWSAVMIPELPIVGVRPSAASGRLTGCAALVRACSSPIRGGVAGVHESGRRRLCARDQPAAVDGSGLVDMVVAVARVLGVGTDLACWRDPR